ncbi:MASE4 domain-containing protein [Methylobacterium sp. 77]|uniref:MASE4 domain-containing protein n=1 Tax=Methylobacterium sp. 77 TaxID=1101192 RepID=UPI00039BA0D1|nr:MASE4 domain-containing protein [Methylobacterium sp. 77]
MTPDRSLETLASAPATTLQRMLAVCVASAFAAMTVALLPIAASPTAPMPGFVPSYQSALIAVYAVTTFLLFTQYRRTRSVPLLLLAAGSLYTTLIVLVQLLSFPNVFAAGRLLGTGPDTTTWLWTFWHIGPPLFALPYALAERGDRDRRVPSARTDAAAWWTVVGTVLLVGLIALLVHRYVAWLPKSVEGDDYSLLATSGIGPGVVALTLVALVTLCWTTRLRTVLQLWLAVSLLLLVLDSVITMAGAARGTVGWFSGRMEALAAGIIVLGVYLREVDFLYGRAEGTAAERERQRAELQLARDNLAIALDAADMGDWSLDLSADTSRRSLRHDSIFGYDTLQPRWGLAELRGHVLPDDAAILDDAIASAARQGGFETEFRIRRAGDGAIRWVALRGKAYLDEAGDTRSLAGIVMDTTDRREAQERIVQGQKMEAIGQLTGGVAHDFNNLLTIIVGNLDMMLRRSGDAQRVEKLAHSAMVAARRGAEVTEKLLAYSRRQVLRPETVNPNRLLMDFRTLLHRAVGETIGVSFELDASLDPVRLDPGQFESAVLNLAVNARDAMPAGGTLVVRTANAEIGVDRHAGLRSLSPGAYVRITVTDSGTGMDAATVARAFEPFFTTKEVGKGTGLGLSQVYGFAQQAGGTVHLSSEPGRGSAIDIYLPRSSERAVERQADQIMPLRRAVEGEVVLVVEDEPAVLDMAVDSLTDLGYRTVTASHAAAALDRLGSEDRIDILFSDVVMPGGMNGVQLAVEARRRRPALRILLTSGYTGNALGDQGVPADQPLLSKPYLRQDLAEKLRLVMGRA